MVNAHTGGEKPTDLRSGRRHPKSFWRRNNRGQGMVELVLVLPLLLLLLAGIFEFGRHYYTRLTLRHAVAEAARFGVTGNQLIDPLTSQPMTRAQSIVQVIQDRASGLSVDVTNIQITPADGGQPDQVVRIAVSYRYHFLFNPVARFFEADHIDFSVMTAMRNEPAF
jgi:Flp pilus assembly protein TadG